MTQVETIAPEGTDHKPTEAKTLKEQLRDRGMPPAEVEKFLTYVNSEMRKEKAAKLRDPKKGTPVTNNDNVMLLEMALKFYRMGLTIDGTNAVITGKSMAMVTYHGYKNTLLRVYPETEIDMQLVREGDEFSVAKESGSIVYTHNIKDAFGNANIVGAYVVIKNKRGEFLETLNRQDYESMKSGSKQSSLWDKWQSEFWLKSVLKRACKRHFNDIVEDIDKNDNDDFGVKTESIDFEFGDEEVEHRIRNLKSRQEALKLLSELTPAQKLQAVPQITQKIKELEDGKADSSTSKK